MLESLIQLIILFFVIIDPLVSMAIFIAASKKMSNKEKYVTATFAVSVAAGLSALVILLGTKLLEIFSTTLDEFRIAGGIILCILGIKMTLGYSLISTEKKSDYSGRAIAAIIGTPFLTGPATITAIIISVQDFGRLLTSLAVGIVLLISALMLFQAERISNLVGKTAIQVISTILGMVILAWGVKFILQGLTAIL